MSYKKYAKSFVKEVVINRVKRNYQMKWSLRTDHWNKQHWCYLWHRKETFWYSGLERLIVKISRENVIGKIFWVFLKKAAAGEGYFIKEKFFSRMGLFQKACMLMRMINWYRSKMELITRARTLSAWGGVGCGLNCWNSIASRSVQPLTQE